MRDNPAFAQFSRTLSDKGSETLYSLIVALVYTRIDAALSFAALLCLTKVIRTKNPLPIPAGDFFWNNLVGVGLAPTRFKSFQGDCKSRPYKRWSIFRILPEILILPRHIQPFIQHSDRSAFDCGIVAYSDCVSRE